MIQQQAKACIQGNHEAFLLVGPAILLSRFPFVIKVTDKTPSQQLTMAANAAKAGPCFKTSQDVGGICPADAGAEKESTEKNGLKDKTMPFTLPHSTRSA